MVCVGVLKCTTKHKNAQMRVTPPDDRTKASGVDRKEMKQSNKHNWPQSSHVLLPWEGGLPLDPLLMTFFWGQKQVNTGEELISSIQEPLKT